VIQNTMFSPINVSALQNALPAPVKATPAEATESFATFLKTAIDGVAAQENTAHAVTDKFIIGEADINDVMLASTKAELSLSLTAQVRNKMIEAYQEIMRMQV
jgi:flagellar hook-basal body complex protein FliE